LAIGTFLPFISFFGQRFTLWDYPVAPETGAAILFVVLGVLTALVSLKGGKTMSVASLSFGIAGTLLLLVKKEFTFVMFGIGAWLMLVGGLLAIAGGTLGMKGN
jgi:hypothetical protein